MRTPLSPALLQSEDYILEALSASYMNILQDDPYLRSDATGLPSALSSVARWLTKPTARPSLLLSGGVGCGKTTTLRAVEALLRALSEFDALPWVHGGKPGWSKGANLRVCFATAIDAAKAAQFNGDAWNKDIMQAQALLLDDIGTEPSDVKHFGTVIQPVTEIIMERYRLGRWTIISTNRELSDMKMLYGERVQDRLFQMCDRITFTNSSYRQQ